MKLINMNIIDNVTRRANVINRYIYPLNIHDYETAAFPGYCKRHSSDSDVRVINVRDSNEC